LPLLSSLPLIKLPSNTSKSLVRPLSNNF
jgi:hypothetical protein